MGYKIWTCPFWVRSGLDNHFAHSKVERGLTLLAEMDRGAAHAVLVGDTLQDVEVAQAMGIDCILVSGGHQSEGRLRACNVPLIQSLAELPHQIASTWG